MLPPRDASRAGTASHRTASSEGAAMVLVRMAPVPDAWAVSERPQSRPRNPRHPPARLLRRAGLRTCRTVRPRSQTHTRQGGQVRRSRARWPRLRRRRVGQQRRREGHRVSSVQSKDRRVPRPGEQAVRQLAQGVAVRRQACLRRSQLFALRAPIGSFRQGGPRRILERASVVVALGQAGSPHSVATSVAEQW